MQTTLAFFKLHPEILSLLTFFVGLLVGNWQAVGRDKRKEFNELSREPFVGLNKQISTIEKVGTCGTSVGDLLLIESHMPWHKRGNFRKSVQLYRDAHVGVSTYNDTNASVIFDREKLVKLRVCAKRLRSYLRPR